MDLTIVITDENKEVLDRISVYRDGSDSEGAAKIRKMIDEEYGVEFERPCGKLLFWDYEEFISVFSDYHHYGWEVPEWAQEKLYEAANEVVQFLRRLTGKPHEISNHDERGLHITYEDMFSDKKEAEKWYGFVDSSEELLAILEKYNITWES